MGSTEEGAIDPLDEIVALRDEVRAAGKAGFWIHADAGLGAVTSVRSRFQIGSTWARGTRTLSVNDREIEIALELPGDEVFSALEALGQCDSITIDPHKLGYIPYPAGAVCLKSRGVLPLVRQEAPYIAERFEPGGQKREPESIGVYVLEGSKPGAAAASVWLSHSTIPLDNTGHGRLLRDTVRNACQLHGLLEYWPQLEPEDESDVQAVTLCPPDSNIVCCAFRAPGMSLVEINHLNEELYGSFSLTPEQRGHMHEQKFFVSRTHMALPPLPARIDAPIPGAARNPRRRVSGARRHAATDDPDESVDHTVAKTGPRLAGRVDIGALPAGPSPVQLSWQTRDRIFDFDVRRHAVD